MYDESQSESPNEFQFYLVLFKYKSCVKCKSKIEVTNNCYGRCWSCSMLQSLDRVKETFSAVLMVSQEDGDRVEIQAFERELHAIAQIEDGSIEHRLTLNSCNLKTVP